MDLTTNKKHTTKLNCGFVVCVICIVMTLLSPIIFTLPCFCEMLNFSKTETGNIGSTIGGITSPFVGLLSAILLYITLKEQRNYNHTTSILSLMESLYRKDKSFCFSYSFNESHTGYTLSRLNSIVKEYECNMKRDLKFTSACVDSIYEHINNTILQLALIKEMNNKSSDKVKKYIENEINAYASVIIEICQNFINKQCMILDTNDLGCTHERQHYVKKFKQLHTITNSIIL